MIESVSHRGGASVPLEAESKTPKGAKVVTIREESGGEQVKVLERNADKMQHERHAGVLQERES